MKTLVLLASVFLLPVAFAAGEKFSSQPPAATAPTPNTVKTDDVPPTLAQEAQSGLFDRVRGAHLRAVQRGNVASGKSASPVKAQ